MSKYLQTLLHTYNKVYYGNVPGKKVTGNRVEHAGIPHASGVSYTPALPWPGTA